jgi:hypothetical protein
VVPLFSTLIFVLINAGIVTGYPFGTAFLFKNPVLFFRNYCLSVDNPKNFTKQYANKNSFAVHIGLTDSRHNPKPVEHTLRMSARLP